MAQRKPGKGQTVAAPQNTPGRFIDRMPVRSRPGQPGRGTRGQPAPPTPRPTRGLGMIVRFSRRAETKKSLLRHDFVFQCPPTDGFRWTAAYSHTDYDTVGAGQFSRAGGRQLKQFSFSTLFVDWDATWMAWHYGSDRGAAPIDPMGWSEELLELLESGTPFNVTVGTPAEWGSWDIRELAVTMRNLEVEERAGEPDAKYIDVQLVEWRPLDLTRKRRGLPVVLTLHEKGDKVTWNDGTGVKTMQNPSLTRLAKRFYGSSARWRPIAKHPKNKHLVAYAGKDLLKYVQRHGRGKKGDKHIKITIPELPETAKATAPGEEAVIGPT